MKKIKKIDPKNIKSKGLTKCIEILILKNIFFTKW